MSSLKPSDLSDIPLFDEWSSIQETTLSNGNVVNVQNGSITQEGHLKDGTNYKSYFSKMLKVVTPRETSAILSSIKSIPFDTDPDSVDGMCSHELYIDNPEIRNNGVVKNGIQFYSSSKYTSIRKRLTDIINPIVEKRITPYVRMLYSSSLPPDRQCTVCYCLIRKYNKYERMTHATHRDGHAFATVVISLSDYEKHYRGGLYVATSERYKNTVALNRGDAIVHKHDLLHGVKVKNDGGERWSLILWYKDSTTCEDHSVSWYKDKAIQGIPVYQALYANVAGNDAVEWHQKAALQGFSNSMIKLARAYLKLLPSHLPFNTKEAERLYRLAITTSQDPHAQYGLAEMILNGWIDTHDALHSSLKQVIMLLEESAKGGNVFAMFNLGVAHLYGYTGKRDIQLAKEWFEMSNLPEGFVCASMFYDSIGNVSLANQWRERARKMGYYSNWRQHSRKSTGLGGAGGVDINLSWPPLSNGIKPQIM